MSVAATEWVWSHSEASGNTLLVLLAIADAADQEGGNAWPAQQTLADRARVTTRTVRRLVADLVEMGEVEVEKHAGGTRHTRDDRRPHLYRLPKMAGQNGRTQASPRGPSGGQPTAPRADIDGATGGHCCPKNVLLERPEEQELKDPSGGAAAAAPALEPESPLEEPMPRTAAPADVPALFDVEPESRPVREKTPGPADVVAAFVASFRDAHGAEPLKRDKARVGRDARAFLRDGEATLDELVVCARTMGKTTYANLGQQLKFKRHDASSKAKFHPATEYVPDEWSDLKALSDQAVAGISASIWDEVPA